MVVAVIVVVGVVVAGGVVVGGHIQEGLVAHGGEFSHGRQPRSHGHVAGPTGGSRRLSVQTEYL